MCYIRCVPTRTGEWKYPPSTSSEIIQTPVKRNVDGGFYIYTLPFMLYHSTRGAGDTARPFSEIMMAALAPDGGLYIPRDVPRLDMAALRGLTYQEIAQKVIAPFVDIPADDLRSIIHKSYAPSVFASPDITPLHRLDDNLSVLELFHGPTLAFKDVALQFLGHVFDYILDRKQQSITIIGATSGDTGSAALEAFRGKKNVNIIILHPHERTSDIQRRQMTTIDDANVFNLALRGTFDDAQSIVKRALNDADIQSHKTTTAVNSINWARIVAQIVYYVVACVRLQERGIDRTSFAVPTGNFGNIYAGYVAKKMGAPIDQLIIGSNQNDILTRFFETGHMTQDKINPSNSPSMDIQISSNFERYLYDMVGQNSDIVTDYMNDFKNSGEFAVTKDQYARALHDFKAYRCDDQGTINSIRDCYARYQYIMDPHTAVGLSAARQSGIEGHIVTMACAHPAKFPETVFGALEIRASNPPQLNGIETKIEKYQIMDHDYDQFKSFIMNI